MTEAQTEALKKLRLANGGPVILHTGCGGSLVKKGLATKDNTTGHGKLMAAYRLYE